MNNYIMLSQKEIEVLTRLAEKGPLTRYDLTLAGKRFRTNRKALMSSATWQKIWKHLGPDGLKLLHHLNPRGRPPATKRQKKPLWLTIPGVFAALTFNASPKLLLKNVKRLMPQNETVQCFVEASEYLNPNALKYAYDKIMMEKSKPTAKDYLMIMMFHAENYENKDALLNVLKKYPQIYRDAVEVAENFKQLADAFQKESLNKTMQI